MAIFYTKCSLDSRVIRNLYDYRRLGIEWYEKQQIMDGDMALEIEGAGHFIGYQIVKLVWPIPRY